MQLGIYIRSVLRFPARGGAEGDAPTLSGRGRMACFGPWAVGAAAKLSVGRKKVVLLWLREGAQGGGGRQDEGVRGLPAEAANLRAAGGREEGWCSGSVSRVRAGLTMRPMPARTMDTIAQGGTAMAAAGMATTLVGANGGR